MIAAEWNRLHSGIIKEFMKSTKLSKIRAKFYLVNGDYDLANYGVYRLGLTYSEVNDYIIARSGTVNTKRIINKFWMLFGINTCAVCNDVVLYYRHDVKRFADLMFLNKKTYFD